MGARLLLNPAWDEAVGGGVWGGAGPGVFLSVRIRTLRKCAKSLEDFDVRAGRCCTLSRWLRLVHDTRRGGFRVFVATTELEYPMKALRCRVVVAFFFVIGVGSSAQGVSNDVATLLNAMPGDVPLSVVIPSAEEFDARLAEAMKAFDPNAESPGLVSQLKDNIKLADWIDFTKPVGLAQSEIGNDDSALVFAVVPGFGEKAKGLESAKNEDGVWALTFDVNTTIYAAEKGGYVVASKSKEALTAGLNSKTKLTANLAERISLLDHKQILVEVNFEPVRPMALGGIMQLSAFAPMLAMSAAADGSADPAAIAGLVTSATEGLQKFAEQVAFVDIALGIENGAVSATLLPSFNDGAISRYLAAQKPGADFFKGANTDAYMVALSWQFPGEKSEFFDYLFTKMEAAAAPSPMMMGQPQGGGDPKTDADAKLKATKESLALARKLYTVTRGMNTSFSFSPTGMIATGDYFGGDASELFSLLAESLSKSNPISDMFGGGAKYQESGSRKIGNVEVKEFAITLDPNKASTAKAAAIYGESTRFTMGVVGDRVRYCVGSEGFANEFFSAKSSGSVDAGIAALMKNLPARKNVVVALNAGAIMGMVGPLLGGGAAPAAAADGPPIGLSISLVGEARLDLHVPLAAIKPLLGAGGGGAGEPM